MLDIIKHASKFTTTDVQWIHRVPWRPYKFYLWSPSRRHHIVVQGTFGKWSKTDSSKCSNEYSNTLVLLDSEHSYKILQQLRATLRLLTTCCPTTWRRQQWPQRVLSMTSVLSYVQTKNWRTFECTALQRSCPLYSVLLLGGTLHKPSHNKTFILLTHLYHLSQRQWSS